MKIKSDARWRRKMRVRRKIRGTAERPRLSVFRSNKHIYAQLIDDRGGRTIVSVSSLSPACRERLGERTGKKDAATAVGTLLAERAKQVGIVRVIFDRGWYSFHGRVKAVAEAARRGGLTF